MHDQIALESVRASFDSGSSLDAHDDNDKNNDIITAVYRAFVHADGQDGNARLRARDRTYVFETYFNK